MAERIRKISEREPKATIPPRDPKREIHEHVVVEGEHLVVEQNGEAVVLPLELGSNNAQRFIALAALLALCYFGKLVLATITFALSLAFILEPAVELLERIRVPRGVAALFVLIVLGGVLYGISYFSYVRAMNFAHELPKYTEKVKEKVVKFRQQTQQLEKTGQAIAPAGEKNVMPVKPVSTGLSGLTSAAGTLTEAVLALSFVPFLAYFMVTWKEHTRAGVVRLFKPEDRTNAYVAIGRMAKMLRGFIVGNLVIGLIMGVMSLLVFWWIGVPYFYFVGFISGFLSLIPYIGVLAALLPPIGAGLGQLGFSHLAEIVVAVFGIHVFSLNVLYPKFLGSRVQLNPLIVTISLLMWGYIWGATGLVLAIPIMAATKIICDHVDSLRGLGELMGEGRSSS